MSIGKRLKQRLFDLNIKQNELAKSLNISPTTLNGYFTDYREPDIDMLKRLAEALDTNVGYLIGATSNSAPTNAIASDAWLNRNADFVGELVSFPEIGSIKAGYDGAAIEEYSGEAVEIPLSMLHGIPAKDFFVLRVTGDSMYPKFLDGDKVLVQKCTSVDSGSIAVILYNSYEGTLKKVHYSHGEDWLELIPINPEYQIKRIEGVDLEQCRVLGKVVKLIRDV